MKLSTRSQYGLRIMLNLGLHVEGKPLQLSEIATREQISEKYLGQIIMPLRASGLVNSVRGSQGGYYLSRPAREITVLQVVEAIEGEISIVDAGGDTGSKRRAVTDQPASVAATGRVWRKVTDCIRQTLGEFTVEDLLEYYSREAGVFDFSI
ncbi:MAG: Rrf2 family transcriptional regulator [Spirochaeta sp.]|nr:Rrf2 family transcriptional regulator [Spirochaeta sp.]